MTASRPFRDTLCALLVRHDRAISEMARLQAERDFGSGERTGRMANLAAWDAELTRVEAELDALSGGRWHNADGRLDLDALRALLAAD